MVRGICTHDQLVTKPVCRRAGIPDRSLTSVITDLPNFTLLVIKERGHLDLSSHLFTNNLGRWLCRYFLQWIYFTYYHTWMYISSHTINTEVQCGELQFAPYKLPHVEPLPHGGSLPNTYLKRFFFNRHIYCLGIRISVCGKYPPSSNALTCSMGYFIANFILLLAEIIWW